MGFKKRTQLANVVKPATLKTGVNCLFQNCYVSNTSKD